MRPKIKISLFVLMALLQLSVLTSTASAQLVICGTNENSKVPVDSNPDPKTKSDYNNITAYQDALIPLVQKRLAKQISEEEFFRQDAALKSQYGVCQASDIPKQIARLINWAIGFIGTFVTFRLVISGFQMVMADGNQEKISLAKKGVTNAIIGLVIVLLAFVIVNVLFKELGLGGFNVNPFVK